MRGLRTLSLHAVALAVALASARAYADEPPCDPSEDGPNARGCTRFIVPAFVATSSIQPYASLNISGGWRSATAPAFAGTPGQSLSQYALTATPQFGLAVAPFSLIYFGGDGSAVVGGNEGSLIGQGGLFTGDYFIGLILQGHAGRWRFALNSRLLRGLGEAIQAQGLVEGVTANFTNATFLPALKDLGQGFGHVLLPYSVTSGRFDLAVAYDLGSLTLQAAFGVEALRDDFSASGQNQLSRVLTTSFPRVGVAVGFDPNEAFGVDYIPFALLAEYQITVNKSWVTLSGQPGAVSSPSAAENVAALGVYLPRVMRDREDLQLGVVAFDDFGHSGGLVASTGQTVAPGLTQEIGAIANFRYFF